MSYDQFIKDWITPRLQDPLLAARAAAKTGKRIIGYVGADVPVELILAADALPVRLRGLANDSTPLADEYLESAFLPETRALAEQWLRGDLDFIDAVVFPRSGDSSQRLYYYLCELQRRKRCAGPEPLLYDLATITRQTSRDHTVSSTLQLVESLGTVTAQLPHAMTRVAQRVSLLTQIQAARGQRPALLGSLGLLVARVAEVDWTHEFDTAVALWLRKAPTVASGARLLLVGSVPPDASLHLAVEAAKGTIVSELVETQYSTAPSSSDSNSNIAALAQRQHDTVSPAQHMLRSSGYVTEQARGVSAHGVIIWMIEEDETLPWELVAQTRALTAAKIPVLTLTRQQWRADSNALNAIAEFVGTLECGR